MDKRVAQCLCPGFRHIRTTVHWGEKKTTAIILTYLVGQFEIFSESFLSFFKQMEMVRKSLIWRQAEERIERFTFEHGSRWEMKAHMEVLP